MFPFNPFLRPFDSQEKTQENLWFSYVFTRGSVGKNRLIGILVNTYSESPEGVAKNFTKFANACVGVFFLKKTATLLRKRLQHRCFSVNFVKFLRTHFLQKTLRRLCHFQIVVFIQCLRLVHSGQRSWRKMDTLKKSGKTWKIRKDCKRNGKFRKKSWNFNLRYTVFFFFLRILINFICNIFQFFSCCHVLPVSGD